VNFVRASSFLAGIESNYCIPNGGVSDVKTKEYTKIATCPHFEYGNPISKFSTISISTAEKFNTF
jgi:hypothetical protein